MSDPPIPLPLVILIVFGSAKLLAELFERLGQPGIVGEIVAGALIGPSGLAWITPSETLKALSDMGIMLLLFGAGLEVKARDLVRIGLRAALVATLGEVVPFLAGWGLLLAWGATKNEAIFAGASMVATSIGITASVLSARGLLHEVASRIILAAAVIDDVLGLIVVSVVSSIALGHVKILQIALTTALATGFTVVLALWGTTAVSRLFAHFRSRARAEEAQFHFAMVVLFALAVLALYTGVAAIVGAFLAGMALSDSADTHVRDLTSGVSELLVPFFLAGIGLRFDSAIFGSGPTILLALLVLGAAVVTKLIGCGAGAWHLGWRNMLRVGLGMAPRGEVANGCSSSWPGPVNAHLRCIQHYRIHGCRQRACHADAVEVRLSRTPRRAPKVKVIWWCHGLSASVMAQLNRLQLSAARSPRHSSSRPLITDELAGAIRSSGPVAANRLGAIWGSFLAKIPARAISA